MNIDADKTDKTDKTEVTDLVDLLDGDGDGNGSGKSLDPLQPLQLQDILMANYNTSEMLTGDNKYDCKHCSNNNNDNNNNTNDCPISDTRPTINTRQDAVKSTSITTYPPVLFIPLMRYMYDYKSGVKKKLQVYMCICVYVCMCGYINMGMGMRMSWMGMYGLCVWVYVCWWVYIW